MTLTLKNHILIPVLGIVLITSSTLSVTCFVLGRKALDKAIHQQMSEVNAATVRQVDDWIKAKQLDLEQWASRPEYLDMLVQKGTNSGLQASINAELGSIKKRYGFYDEIQICDAKGDVVASSNPKYIGTINIKDRKYFQMAIKGQAAVSEVLASRATQNPIVVLATPIRIDAQILGVAFSVVNLDVFSAQFIDPIRVLQSGYLYMCDEAGVFIAHRDKTKILKAKMADYEWGSQVMGQKKGRVNYRFDGVDKQVTFDTSTALNWKIAVTVPLAELNAPINAMGRYCVLLGFIALAFGLVMAVWLARSIAAPIARSMNSLLDGAGQLDGAARQISAASQSLAEGASEQAASLEETSSSLEEMAGITRQNAEHAQSAKDLAKQTRQAADLGAADMRHMNQAMEAIKGSSSDISKIIKTIDEIAFQTNILALNAAVEAARAGEAGMGFAVVADEVRNLAQRCASAARETSDKIEDAIQKTQQGVQISAKVSLGLQEIVVKVRQVDELIADVANASREQSQGAEQVNTAVSQMDKVTQSSAASAEECASAAEELSAQSASLKEAVEGLRSLIEGRNKMTVDAAHRATNNESQPNPERHTVYSPLKFEPVAPMTRSNHSALSATASAKSEPPGKDVFRDF